MFDRDQLDGYGFPNARLRSRADWIAIAYEDSKRFDELFSIWFPPEKHPDVARRIEQMPLGFPDAITPVIEDIDVDLARAESAESIYRSQSWHDELK